MASGGARSTPLSRDLIVSEARDMIARSGPEALSLRRLASHLGVTAPAFYAHVRDKQDLLRAVAEVEFAALVARYEDCDDADPVARMRTHARIYVEASRRQPELFQLMFLFPPQLDAADLPEAAVLGAATSAFEHAARAVEEAIAAGAIATDDPLLTTLTLWAGAHGVATVLQMGFGLPADLEDRMIDEMVDRLIAGYRPEP